MIRFPCKCGYQFEVPLDMAGKYIQCPQCSLLVDIPTLSDLPNLNPDGTFAFDPKIETPDQTTAADLHRAFTNQTTDSRGRQKDLRMHAEQLESVGLHEHEPLRVAPRYDPVTGELIRPLPVKDEPPLPVLAIAEEVDPAEVDHLDAVIVPTPVIPLTGPVGPRSLKYASGIIRKVVTLKTLAIELLMPANVAVMFFVFLIYIGGYFTTVGLAAWARYASFVIVRPLLLVNVPLLFILSHLACIIEDTGPDAIDELPRPLRNFSFGDDFFTPLMGTLFAVAICFLPFSLTYHYLDPANPMTAPIYMLFGLAGAFLFPAVVLTMVTGATELNLRPDRVAAVIRLCGIQYFASVALFVLCAVPTVYYLGNAVLFFGQLQLPFFGRIERPGILFPALALTVYLLHFFGWHLGMMYRAKHAEFPWLGQYFVKEEKP